MPIRSRLERHDAGCHHKVTFGRWIADEVKILGQFALAKRILSRIAMNAAALSRNRQAAWILREGGMRWNVSNWLPTQGCLFVEFVAQAEVVLGLLGTTKTGQQQYGN